jgi:MYXO-CTERM domain-containing protein
VAAVELGHSVEGRAIRGVRISHDGEDVRQLVITAGQHAREWIAVMATTCVAAQLAEADDPAIESLLGEVTVVVVPVVNPDGYVYSWEVDRYWRKNRGDENGVDLNRNWSIGWGGKGSSSDPDHNNYRGKSPFSEPEAAAVREWLEDSPVVSYIDVHTFGELVLYPWAIAIEAEAPEHLAQLASAAAENLAAVHGEPYVALQSVELYPAAGTSIDFAYGTLGIHALTLELRPQGGSEEWDFVMPANHIEPTCEELMAAVVDLLQWTATAKRGTPGDDGSATTSTGATGGSGSESGASSSSDAPVTTDAVTSARTTYAEESIGTTGVTSTGLPSPAPGAPDGAMGDGGCGCKTHDDEPPSWGWLSWAGLVVLVRRTRRTRRFDTRAAIRRSGDEGIGGP